MPRRTLVVLSGIARRDAAGSRTLPEGQRSSFWQPPIKTTERREQAASGATILWMLSFADCTPAFSAFTTSMWLGEAKESVSPVGARTHIQITVALVTLIKITSLCSGFRQSMPE
ncbi:hypothetical protein [Methyloglobulus sp.]|uniref:hypothetical protein n=1 Tax=Methyloglobulus sp. TaxID=2518622 RepID=UPI0032B83E19